MNDISIKCNHDTEIEIDHLIIVGFSNKDLEELQSMEYYESLNKIIEILDSRFEGLGSRYRDAYGIYKFYISDSGVCLDVGRYAR